jgi:hypothetical protein
MQCIHVSYTVNIKGLNEYYSQGKMDAAVNNIVTNENVSVLQQAGENAAGILHSGFVAQEVEAAAKKLNYEFDGVDKPENKEGLYGLRYENFVAPLVKAVQELSKQNEDLKKQNEDLQQQINAIKEMIGSNAKTGPAFNNASLEQNTPNPLNVTTHHQI